MNKDENPLSILFYLLSIVIAIVGVILGIFFVMDDKELGIVVIIFSIISGVILFGISKVLQLLAEIRNSMLAAAAETEEKKVNEAEETAENNDQENQKEEAVEKERPFNEPVEWALSPKQKANILEYYQKDNQTVTENDIFASPFKEYCVVKTRKFVDVIELVDDYPITLNRDQVESFKELRQWIEKNVFLKRKK